MSKNIEKNACTPVPVSSTLFNSNCKLPYGLTTEHVRNAMTDFIDFIGFINQQLYTKDMQRLESFLMPANFSSIVGEFMNMSIPKYCLKLVKNQYHNGHPDLIPTGLFPDNSIQYAEEGLEVKGLVIQEDGRGIIQNQCGLWFFILIVILQTIRKRTSDLSHSNLKEFMPQN